jgi:hypothetical protein
MRLSSIVVAILFAAWSTGFSVAAEPAAQRAELEQMALETLVAQKVEGFQTLADRIAGLGMTERLEIPLRVRSRAVEFRFRGEFPGPAIANIEYIISRAGEKDHETLLAVKSGELKRLHQLRDALDKLARAGHRIRMDVRLVWSQDGKPHAEDLEDILALNAAYTRSWFARELQINDSGLGSFNATHDPAAIPAKAGPAEVHITVRVEK